MPWSAVLAVALQVAQEGRKRWDRLSAREQRQITDTLRRSKGRIDRISARDRDELRRIVWRAVGRK
jgi:hypothetical protein